MSWDELNSRVHALGPVAAVLPPNECFVALLQPGRDAEAAAQGLIERLHASGFIVDIVMAGARGSLVPELALERWEPDGDEAAAA